MAADKMSGAVFVVCERVARAYKEIFFLSGDVCFK